MCRGERKALLNKRGPWMLSEYRWRNGVAKKERRNVFFVVEEETRIVVLLSSCVGGMTTRLIRQLEIKLH
jgi:hypothetical protein